MFKLSTSVLLLSLASTGALAQSNVTLYGRVAGGVDFVNNVARPDGSTVNLNRFGSNQWGISWWGLKGEEDLGGGLKTVFNLESMNRPGF